MAAKCKGGAKFPRKALPCHSGSGADEQGRAYARLLTSPELAAYRVIGMMQPQNLADDIDAPTLLATVREQATRVQAGDLSHAEAMLVSQAMALESVFVRLAERAMEQVQMPHLEAFMRLALRAQSQSRATLETLAAIKNPPIVYARQANVTTGPQQVNNGVAATGHAPRAETADPPVKLLEEQTHGERLDTRAPGTAGGSDTPLEAVGARHRSPDP